MLLMPDFDDVPDALDGELNGAPDAATSCARWNHVRIEVGFYAQIRTTLSGYSTENQHL